MRNEAYPPAHQQQRPVTRLELRTWLEANRDAIKAEIEHGIVGPTRRQFDRLSRRVREAPEGGPKP
jgi:hypothetical protein